VTRLFSVDDVMALLHGDRQLYDQLVELGYCHPLAEGVSADEVEAARVAQVLVRELEVNWAGVEVALAMREQVLGLRRQMAELLELLGKQKLQT
jgi:hypothetical protein